jgi:transglutaminase-like putative cysteine protease
MVGACIFGAPYPQVERFVHHFMAVFHIRHATTYRYVRPVTFGGHRLMFRPRDSFDQRLLAVKLRVKPQPHNVRWIHDVFGNCIAIVDIAASAKELCFETNIRVDHTPHEPLDLRMDDEAQTYPFSYDPEELPDVAPMMAQLNLAGDDPVRQWSRQFVRSGRPTDTGRLLMTMCNAIHEGFSYARRLNGETQSPAVTLELRRGTCRDFAVLMMEAVRSLGFAARFVSGYLYVPDRDGSRKLGGGSTHAWCQVYLPGAGWVEFDPTNGIVGNRDLIRVAVARTQRQAIPLVGTYAGSPDDFLEMDVQVNVTTSTQPGRRTSAIIGQ